MLWRHRETGDTPVEERADGASGTRMPASPRASRRPRHDDALARLQFALDAAGVGTWQWEVRTGQVTWSDNLEVIHGLPPGSFGGDFASFLDDVDPRDREAVMARIKAAMTSGGDYHVE